jgi:SNF2 family DNA or RNA helicase
MDFMPLSAGQMDALDWMLTHKKGMLPLRVGYGKTRIGLAKILEVHRPAIVVSTKHIIEKTWPDEIRKLRLGLSYAACCGSKKERERALASRPDVLGVSFENLRWYYQQKDRSRPILFIDESSKMKDHLAKRVRSQVNHAGLYEYAYALSATPAPEGAMGLWAQFACLMRDRPLGTLTQFRQAFFDAELRPTHTEYTLKEGALGRISRALSPYFYSPPPQFLNEIGIPDPAEVEIVVPWSDEVGFQQYEDMARNLCLEANEEYDLERLVEAGTPGVLQNKLRQMASGFIYDPYYVRNSRGKMVEKKRVQQLLGHDDKIRELGYFMERIGDQPLLIATQFEEEVRQIAEAFPEFQIGLPDSLDDWNKGRIPGMVIHPKSAGHGLNLQDGSHNILFYSLPWGQDDYDQLIGRLSRRGQKHQVTASRFVREGTIEERMYREILIKRADQANTIEELGRATTA